MTLKTTNYGEHSVTFIDAFGKLWTVEELITSSTESARAFARTISVTLSSNEKFSKERKPKPYYRKERW